MSNKKKNLFKVTLLVESNDTYASDVIHKIDKLFKDKPDRVTIPAHFPRYNYRKVKQLGQDNLRELHVHGCKFRVLDKVELDVEGSGICIINKGAPSSEDLKDGKL